MAYQNNNSNRPKDPILSHYSLVKNGPKLAAIKSPPKWVKNNSLCVVELVVDGVNHVYFTEKREISEKFLNHIGKSVVLIASGNSKQGSDSMEIQEAGVPASSLPNAPRPQDAPQSRQDAPQGVISSPPHTDKAAKTFLCQAANLMRLCVKKANDISVELGLGEAHRQGIATTLFIQADRQGFISTMPITAYTPEQLGFGASSANTSANTETEPSEDK